LRLIVSDYNTAVKVYLSLNLPARHVIYLNHYEHQ
jgi:hypothetical protein